MNRLDVLHVRVTREERDAVRAGAAASRRALSDFVRQACLAAAVAAGVDLPRATVSALPPARDELPPTVDALLKILQPLASNLTQIGSHARTLGPAHLGLAEAQVVALVAEIERLRQSVRRLGLAARADELSPHRAAALVENLADLGEAVNALAAACNQGTPPPRDKWREPLQRLREILAQESKA